MEQSWTLSKNLFNPKHFYGGEEGAEQGFQILIFYFLITDQTNLYLSSIMIETKEIILKNWPGNPDHWNVMYELLGKPSLTWQLRSGG
jgi:hypothetical protein